MINIDFSDADLPVKKIMAMASQDSIKIKGALNGRLRFAHSENKDNSLNLQQCKIVFEVHPGHLKLPWEFKDNIRTYVAIPSGAFDTGKSNQNTLILELCFETNPDIEQSFGSALACYKNPGSLLKAHFTKPDNDFTQKKGIIRITGSAQKICNYLNFMQSDDFQTAFLYEHSVHNPDINPNSSSAPRSF